MELSNDQKLELLRVRDMTLSSYLANGWYISEDNVNSRQVTLKREWGFGSYFLAFILILFYIIPGVLYIALKLNNKKIVNY